MPDDLKRPEKEGAEPDNELRQWLRQLRRAQRCPDAEDLIRFASGELDERDAQRIGEHIGGCGLCDEALEGLRRFDQAAAGEQKPSQGSGMERLARRFERFLAKQRRRHGITRSGLKELLWNPVLAYILVLMLAYPAYLGLLHKREPSGEAPQVTASRPIAPANPRAFVLDRVRGAAANEIVLGTGEHLFVLLFWIPVRPGLMYTASITGADGRQIAELGEMKNHDTQGNFSLVCDRRLFPAPGRYILTIVERNVRHEREFQYEFRMGR